MDTAQIREGRCQNDEFHYVGIEEEVTCPVCGAEIITLPIGCECDISEEQIDEAIAWHEHLREQQS
ncbi:MAG: hypothetical protein ACYDBB_21255 [Armatimonadota bacterium]